MRDFSRWIAPKVDLWPPIHEHTRAHTHTHMITHRGRERSRIETREERRIRQAEKFGVRDGGARDGEGRTETGEGGPERCKSKGHRRRKGWMEKHRDRDTSA